MKTPVGVRNCVLVPKFGKHEWAVSVEEKQGVSHREMHDDGSMKLRKGQAQAKFDSLSASTRAMTSAQHAPQEEADKEDDTEEENQDPEGDGVEEDVDMESDNRSVLESDEEGGAASSLLIGSPTIARSSSHMSPAKKAQSAPAVTPKGKGLKAAAAASPSMLHRSPSMMSQTSTIPASPSQIVAKAAAKGKAGRTSFAVKLADKTPAEVLPIICITMIP